MPGNTNKKKAGVMSLIKQGRIQVRKHRQKSTLCNSKYYNS